jgi:hypothetical protein
VIHPAPEAVTEENLLAEAEHVQTLHAAVAAVHHQEKISLSADRVMMTLSL